MSGVGLTNGFLSRPGTPPKTHAICLRQGIKLVTGLMSPLMVGVVTLAGKFFGDEITGKIIGLLGLKERLTVFK